MKTVVAFGGTLGDAFVVVCKLYSDHKRTGKVFRVLRYDTDPRLDKQIKLLFKSTGYTEYLDPCIVFPDVDSMNKEILKKEVPYIEAKWNPTEYESYPFDYSAIDPFPAFTLPPADLDRSNKNIGIQLFGGSEGFNFRGFSLPWLAKLRNHVPRETMNLFLFGTPSPFYDPAQIEAVCARNKITNLIGRISFLEWLTYLQSMNLLFSTEGFSAFFAMSQKVPTVMYNQYFYGVDKSIHPLWLEKSLVININQSRFKNKARFLLRKLLGQKNIYSPKLNTRATADFVTQQLG
jgi:hypothetical protein